MTRRYGRNQKRAHRERIAELERQLKQRAFDVGVALAHYYSAMELVAEAGRERDAAIRAAMLLDGRVLRKMPPDALAAGELRLTCRDQIESHLGKIVHPSMQKITGSLRVLYATDAFRALAWREWSYLILYTDSAELLVYCTEREGTSPRVAAGGGNGLALEVKAFRCKEQPDPLSAAGALQMAMAAGRLVWVKAAGEVDGRRTA